MTVFQGFWHGPPLGPLRYTCLKSFVDRGHSFHLYSYAPVDVPEGVALMNAADVIPLSELFYYDNPRLEKDLGPFSDLFRFKLLMERGGWWSDVDAVCLSRDIPPIRRAWAREHPEHDPTEIGTSQIAFPQGDPIAAELYSRCLAISRTKFSPREALGPHLISRTLSERGLPADEFGDADRFYPIRWVEMFKLWLPKYREEVTQRCANALFLPIYQSFPRYLGFDDTTLPPRGSYLGELLSDLLPDTISAGRVPAEKVLDAVRRYFLENREWAITELLAVCGTDILKDLGLESAAASS